MSDRPDGKREHLTNRRGFITIFGLGTLSLYGLWAAYGAAPTSFKFISDAETVGMAGMGHGAAHKGGMTVARFQKEAEEFFEAHRLADGSIKVGRSGKKPAKPAGDKPDGHTEKVKDDHAKAKPHGHEPGTPDDHAKKVMDDHADEPLDVYVVAQKFSYEPEVLRLERDVPYKFKIMPIDTDHGASINFGTGSRMIRCRAKTLTEIELRFAKKGEFMMYCTVYCGEGHDMMKSKIIVT